MASIISLRIFWILAMFNITTKYVLSEINSLKSPRTTRYSNNEGHNHNQVHYDNAYFYDYRIHGSDKEHHGESQYFGQSEYRNEYEVYYFTTTFSGMQGTDI